MFYFIATITLSCLAGPHFSHCVAVRTESLPGVTVLHYELPTALKWNKASGPGVNHGWLQATKSQQRIAKHPCGEVYKTVCDCFPQHQWQPVWHCVEWCHYDGLSFVPCLFNCNKQLWQPLCVHAYTHTHMQHMTRNRPTFQSCIGQREIFLKYFLYKKKLFHMLTW